MWNRLDWGGIDVGDRVIAILTVKWRGKGTLSTAIFFPNQLLRMVNWWHWTKVIICISTFDETEFISENGTMAKWGLWGPNYVIWFQLGRFMRRVGSWRRKRSKRPNECNYGEHFDTPTPLNCGLGQTFFRHNHLQRVTVDGRVFGWATKGNFDLPETELLFGVNAFFYNFGMY